MVASDLIYVGKLSLILLPLHEVKENGHFHI